MESFQIRVLLRHYWRQHFKAVDATKKICKVEGEGIVSVRTAQKWFKRFNEGYTNLKDEPRSGRPTIVDSEALLNAVEANPSTSSRRLSAELGTAQTSVVRHLHALGKINKRCREVPHDLTENQIQNRVSICRKLLENPLDDRFIRRIVTCDEKWVYFNNPDKRNQWLNPGQAAEPVSKRDRFSRKALLCCVFGGISRASYILNLFQMVKPLTPTSTAPNLIGCMWHLVKNTLLWSIVNGYGYGYSYNKTMQNHTPLDKLKKRSQNSMQSNFYHTQHIVLILRHLTIIFSALWHTSFAGGASTISRMSKMGVGRFSTVRTRNGTATGSSNLAIDGFKPSNLMVFILKLEIFSIVVKFILKILIKKRTNFWFTLI